MDGRSLPPSLWTNPRHDATTFQDVAALTQRLADASTEITRLRAALADRPIPVQASPVRPQTALTDSHTAAMHALKLDQGLKLCGGMLRHARKGLLQQLLSRCHFNPISTSFEPHLNPI